MHFRLSISCWRIFDSSARAIQNVLLRYSYFGETSRRSVSLRGTEAKTPRYGRQWLTRFSGTLARDLPSLPLRQP
jgi:hypothetical protein